MKSKTIVYLMILSAMISLLGMSIFSRIPTVYAQRHGPETDIVRLLTIKSPDAQLIGMQTRQIDFLPDMIRPGDIETLADAGFSIQYTSGFHMGFVGFNLHRPILDDVNFRHALFHGYRQEEIVASIYRYTVSPVQSLIPPAQGGWMATDVPKHPFNPGDPLASTVYPEDHSLCGILRYGGYTYHGTGYGDTGAYWTDSENDPLPSMDFYTPTYEVAPTSAEHGSRITAEWHRCGLNNIDHQPMDFTVYTHLVFDLHDFDIFMIFWLLGRFPMQLYGLCHSSEYVLGSDHAVGLQDPELDILLEDLRFGLDHDSKMESAHEAQRRLYDPEKTSWACAYMLLYSRVYFEGAQPGLDGNVASPGYGSDNGWTWLNWRWMEDHANERIEDGKSVVIYCNGEETVVRSPVSSTTAYEWALVGTSLDGLIAVNPKTHTDMAWQAESWTVEGPITETITLDSDNTWMGVYEGETYDIVDGMKVTFNLVDDLYWQDGNPVTASDCEFSLEFLRENQIPQFVGDWQHIVDVQVIDDDEFVVYVRVTSQFLLYDFAGDALLLPPQVWTEWDGQPLSDILGYDPTTDYRDTGPWSYPDGPDEIPGTGDDPDPTNIGPKTRMFGTGPWVYDYYDPVGMVSEVHAWDAQGANVGYFKTTQEIQELITEIMWLVGDVDRDGEVWGTDKKRWGYAFWSEPGDANWDGDADMFKDDKIDFVDGSLISVHWGDSKYTGAP